MEWAQHNGSNAYQYNESNSNDQQWKIIKSGDYIMIQNRGTGALLMVGWTSNGSICGQWSSRGNNPCGLKKHMGII